MSYKPTVRPRGPDHPDILVIGEAPGQQEELAGIPFVGASGKEQDKMLIEAGINPASVRFTNVYNSRPLYNDISAYFGSSKKDAELKGCIYYQGRAVVPVLLEGVQELRQEIARSQPKVIVTVGNTSLWALTGYWGITKWRGSMLRYDGIPLIPTYHPAAILRQWSWRWIAVNDLRRVGRALRGEGINRPSYRFQIRPSLSQVLEVLRWLDSNVEDLAVDIETTKGQIACVGLAWTWQDALCIPLTSLASPSGYWTEDEEFLIAKQLRSLLQRKHCVGQYFIYDMQYFAKQLGFKPNCVDDTMFMQQVLFPGTQRSLDFICSLYNDYYKYWKDDGKNWEPTAGGEEQHWAYNCEDAVNTLQVRDRMSSILDAFELRDAYNRQMRGYHSFFRMMLRGVRIDNEYQKEVSSSSQAEMIRLQQFLNYVLGFEMNPSSPPQMKKLCYDIFQLPPKYHKEKRGEKRLTCDAGAVEEWLMECEPIFRPILQAIVDYRSMKTFKSTFGEAQADPDGRMRCSYGVAGTFRRTSSEDAFGYGMNLQNIPGEDK